jgi:hypothetical protein
LICASVSAASTMRVSVFSTTGSISAGVDASTVATSAPRRLSSSARCRAWVRGPGFAQVDSTSDNTTTFTSINTTV